MNRRVTCFVCGYMTLDERCDWDICPVCYWEDDVLVIDEQDTSSPANKGMMVSEAQANFALFGASTESRKDHCRTPKSDELLDPKWRLLVEAIQRIKSMMQ